MLMVGRNARNSLSNEMKTPAILVLDELYTERQMINEAIYHIRRYILRMNYKKTRKLIASVKALNGRVRS